MDKSKKPLKAGQRLIAGKSKTQQHFKEEVNINTIVRRYLPSGALPSHGKTPMYGDFTSFDYMSMLNAVSDIDTTFRQLPARVRGNFRNDPYQLLRFIENPDNHKEAVRLGLLVDPSRPFGAPAEGQAEGEIVSDQTDMMNQADIMDALDPESKHHDPSVVADMKAAAAGGDAEAQALLQAHAAREAARKAQRAQGRNAEGPVKKRRPGPPEGD